jgi:hypothetical protein
MCCLETTVYFSPVIDRPRVSVSIVRGLCDVWRKIKSARFITDEQNTLPLCPGEDPVNLVTVRIRFLPGTMVDVSQVMIPNTIICQIHVSRLTTPLCNELRCSCRSTEILVFLTMKLELLSPLLSDSPFLSSKDFLFFRYQNEITLVEDLENFPF